MATALVVLCFIFSKALSELAAPPMHTDTLPYSSQYLKGSNSLSKFLDLMRWKTESKKLEKIFGYSVQSTIPQSDAKLDSKSFYHELSLKPSFALPAVPAPKENFQSNNSTASVVNVMDIAASRNSDNDNGGHSRSKRAISPGAGIPTDYTFTLEALPPFHTQPATFYIGSKISFKLTIWASIEDMNVSAEIYSQSLNASYFMISNVRFGAIGTNFAGYNTSTKEVLYDSKYKDGRWSFATINFGNVSNAATDITNPTASKMELLFEAQALFSDSYKVGNKYSISVGCLYDDGSAMSVSKKELTYANWTTAVFPVEPTVILSGPESVTVKTTGVWRVSASLPNLYSFLVLDVFAPIYEPGKMSIDTISVSKIGTNYKYSVVPDDMGNFTRSNFDGFGDYARLDIGMILNSGYLTSDPNNNTADNTITIDVAITMLELNGNLTTPYTIGFSLWSKEPQSITTLWSAQQSVLVNNNSLPDLTTSPYFELSKSSDSVDVGDTFAVLVNISTPSGSSAGYQVHVAALFNGSETEALIDVKRFRLSRIGHNMPRLSTVSPPDANLSSTDANAYAIWDLGIITNTAQRNGEHDNTLQVEIAIKMLEEVLNYYPYGSEVPITVAVFHADSYYWLGDINITITTDSSNTSLSKVPSVSLTNKMGPEDVIYRDTAAVLDLDIVMPPGMRCPITISADTYLVADNRAKLKIISMEAIHFGEALIHTMNSTSLTGDSSDRDPVTNATIISKAVIYFSDVTSLRDEDYPRFYRKDSTITVRTVVVARADANANIVDNTDYWIEIISTFGENGEQGIFASRKSLKYLATMPDMFSGRVWQPYFGWSILPDSSALVKPGASARFNITIALPYRASALTNVKGECNGNIQVCSVKLLSVGSAIVKYQPPSSLGTQVFRDANTNRSTYALLTQPMMTSLGRNWYYDKFSMDTYMTYQVVANLLPSVTVGSNVTFRVYARVGNIEVPLDPLIAAFNTPMPAKNDSRTLPVLIITHREQTGKINIGGQEIFYIDIYVPPNTQDIYEVDIYAPYNSTFYGSLEIVEAHLVSVGINLECWYLSQTTINVTSSFGNGSGRKNVANFKLGYLINPQPTSVNVTDDNNKVRLMVLVSIPSNTTYDVGDIGNVATMVSLNGVNLSITEADFTVADPADESNVKTGNISKIALNIAASGDQSYIIGERQSYTGTITVPPGTAFSQFKVIIEGPLAASGEALMVVGNVSLVANSAGKHLPVVIQSASITKVINSVNQLYSQTIDFGFVRNTNFSGLSKYFTPGSNNDTVSFTFSLRLMDDAVLADKYVLNMTTRIEFGSSPTKIYAAGAISLTVVAAGTDMPVINFLPYFINKPANITQDTELNLGLDISLDQSSLRFPENLTINYRVPGYSQLKNLSYTFPNSAFVPPSQVYATGLKMEVNKMRYGDAGNVRFTIVVDPYKVLDFGLGVQTLFIIIDIRFFLPNKTNPGLSSQYFTDMKHINFELFIPENYQPLGMQSGNIQDCQIAASFYDDINLPQNVRLNSDFGWSTSGRGQPFFNREYIQVDFGGNVKVTGITIQPFNSDIAERISSFRLRRSDGGVFYSHISYTDGSSKHFDVIWPPNSDENTTVFVALGNFTFISRIVRIFPLGDRAVNKALKMRLELHGYPYPRNSTLPSYICPSHEALIPFVTRQILVLNTTDIFVCMQQNNWIAASCSGSNDFGRSWFVVDDNVINIIGYESNTASLIGVSRNRRNYLRSQDRGVTWCIIEESLYADLQLLGNFVTAQSLPFSVSLNSSQLSSLYTDTGTLITNMTEYGLYTSISEADEPELRGVWTAN